MIKDKKKRINYFIIMQVVILAFSLVICNLQKISILIGLKIFLFQLFGLFLSGIIIVNLIGIKQSNPIELAAYSYFFGIVLTILEYVVLMITGISNYSYILFLFQTSFFIYLYISRKYYLYIDYYDKNWIICILFLVLLNVYCLFSTTLNNTLPNISGDTYYNLDFLFWTGNNISFTKGLPVQNYRIVGMPFYYHYFSSILIAQISFFINEEVQIISLLFSSVIPIILLVLSTYTVLNKFTNRNYLLIIGMLAILFADSTYGFLIGHLYDCPFGFDYAYSIGMISVSYLIDIYRNNTYTIKELIISSVMIAICTGMKGPIAVVILMAYAMIAADLIFTKRIKTGFLFGLTWLFSFVIIYVFFVSMLLCKYDYMGNELEFVGVLGGFDKNIGPINNYVQLKNAYNLADSKLLKLLSIVLFVFNQSRLSFVACVLVFLFLVAKIVKKEKIDIIQVSLGATYAWASLLTLLTHQEGNSQLYFIMSGVPYGVLCGISISDSFVNISKKALTVCYILLLVITLPNVYYSIKYHTVYRFIDGIDTYIGKRNETIDKSRALDGHVNVEDYHVANWIKENTEEDAVLAIDYFEYNNFKNRQIMGVFSNRFIWNDCEYAPYPLEVERRNNLINSFIQGIISVNELKKEGVDYFIKTPSGYDDYYVDDCKTEIIYEKYGYTIYSLK